MNKKLTTADRFPSGGGSYVSPAVSVTEISNEGVLCMSSPTSEGWKEDDLDW